MSLYGFEKQWNAYFGEKKPIENYAKMYFPVSLQKNIILVFIPAKGEYCTRLMEVLASVIHFKAKN